MLVSNKRCMDLMRKLLTKTPAKRLGSFAGGAGDVKCHRWFKDYEWGRIVKRDMPAPWIPTIENPCDTQNFEKVTHDEQQFNPTYSRKTMVSGTKIFDLVTLHAQNHTIVQ